MLLPVQHSNISVAANSAIRIPFAVKTNHASLSTKTKNLRNPSLETIFLSSRAPQRTALKRTPSIRLGESIGGKATVVFEEAEVAAQDKDLDVATKKRRLTSKSSKTKRIPRDDPGKENIPPVTLMNNSGQSTSADLEEIALGLVALRGGQ